MGRPSFTQVSVENYRKYKIKILKQMHIPLTETQLAHLQLLTRRIDIDNYCHDIMMNSR